MNGEGKAALGFAGKGGKSVKFLEASVVNTKELRRTRGDSRSQRTVTDYTYMVTTVALFGDQFIA